ncbi:hypothetical protein D3C74_425280 [compost metagenome]
MIPDSPLHHGQPFLARRTGLMLMRRDMRRHEPYLFQCVGLPGSLCCHHMADMKRIKGPSHNSNSQEVYLLLLTGLTARSRWGPLLAGQLDGFVVA